MDIVWNTVAMPVAAFVLNLLYAGVAVTGLMRLSHWLDSRLASGKSSIDVAYQAMALDARALAIYHAGRWIGICWLAAAFVKG